MVLTIGDDNDGLADTFLLSKTVSSHLYGLGNISSLRCYHRRVDAGKEHLRRHIVAGDGKLYKSVSCKHNQTYLVVGKMIHQVLDHHLAAV